MKVILIAAINYSLQWYPMWKRAVSAVAGVVGGAPVLVGAYATYTINKYVP